MKRITYIISDIDKALAFEWIADKLDKQKYELSFLLLNRGLSQLHTFLESKDIPVKTVLYNGKKSLLRALIQTYRFLKEQKSQMVHCHLFDAGIIGLTAARLAGIKKRIYTRHHSSYHHVYHPQAVKYDRYINNQATHIVAVSGVVADILVKDENVSSAKISVMHHGFDWEAFRPNSETIARLKKRYGVEKAKPVIGVVSRFIEWKGLQYIIPAFQKLLGNHPSAKLLLFNAKGNYEAQVRAMLTEIPPANYEVIVFEKDLLQAYRLFDIFVHTPVDEHSEAFGQVYVEAMAVKVPSIFTLSGIAGEIVRDGENALVVNYRSSEAIYAAMTRLLNDPRLCEGLAINALKTVEKDFSVDEMITKLEELYDRA